MTKRIFCIAASLAIACALNGCVALGIGAAGAAGGVSYAEGRASSTLDASMERVYNASLAELEAQKLPIKHKAIEGDSADINAENSVGDEIRIDIVAKGDAASVLNVRVGLTGNREAESDLLQAIKRRV
jgi:hypothetical protein